MNDETGAYQPPQDSETGGAPPAAPEPPAPPPEGAPPAQAPPPAPGAPTASPGVGAWVSEAWQLVIGNVGMAIGITLLPAAVALVMGAIMFVTAGGGAAVAERGGNVGELLGAGSALLGLIICAAIGIVVMPALQLGIFACLWDMIRTKKLTFEHIMDGASMFGSAIGLGFILGAINMAVSFVAGVVPVIGFLVSVAVSFPLWALLSLSFYHMAVQRAGAIESLTAGWNLLMSDFWNLSLVGLVCTLILVAGIIACGVGVLVAAPVAYTVLGLCYRDMTGAGGAKV